MAKVKKLFIELYLNNNSRMKSYNRTYGRVKHTDTLDTRALAKHIAQHGSIYSLDIIEGVLAKIEACVQELLLDGYNVKLNGIGTFSLRCQSKGVANAEDFSESDLKKLYIKLLPERSSFSSWKKAALKAIAQGTMELTDYIVLGSIVDNKNKNLGRTIKFLPGAKVQVEGAESGGGGSVPPEDEDRP